MKSKISCAWCGQDISESVNEHACKNPPTESEKDALATAACLVACDHFCCGLGEIGCAAKHLAEYKSAPAPDALLELLRECRQVIKRAVVIYADLSVQRALLARLDAEIQRIAERNKL